MELLPNSKCLIKIKIPSQLGLIRELIGLPPVGKQWGYYSFSGGSDNRIVSLNFPMSFSSSCYAILINEASANTETQWINGLAVTAKTKSGFSFKIGFSQNSALHMIATGK